MKPTPTCVRWILSTCAALLSTSAIASIPPADNECVSDLVETTPSGDFTTLKGGEVVRHEPTGLEWRRCAEGMSWTGTSCTGSADTWTWQAALRHADAASGWRLPSIGELRSIVERCRIAPAVNRQVFPDTPSPSFWSASPSAGRSDLAWGVNFHNGFDLWLSKSHPFRVRLVRGGQ